MKLRSHGKNSPRPISQSQAVSQDLPPPTFLPHATFSCSEPIFRQNRPLEEMQRLFLRCRKVKSRPLRLLSRADIEDAMRLFTLFFPAPNHVP